VIWAEEYQGFPSALKATAERHDCIVIRGDGRNEHGERWMQEQTVSQAAIRDAAVPMLDFVRTGVTRELGKHGVLDITWTWRYWDIPEDES
jgi:hypothetical protein